MNRELEYKETMDSLHFTAEQKAALAARAAETAAKAEAQPRRHRRPLGRTAVLAACLAVVLAVSAGATGALKTAVEAFSGIFGGSAAQTEIIDKIGYPVGASDTSGGVTITADAVMGDQYNAVIVYTISRDDGAALLPEGMEETMLLVNGGGSDVTITADAVMGDQYNAVIVYTISRDDGAALLPEGMEETMLLVNGGGSDLNVLGGVHGSSYFVVEDPAASSIQMVETRSSDVPLNDCVATADFENLWYWDEEANQPVAYAEGRWKLRFDVKYEDSAVKLGGGETFSQDGMTFTVDGVTVSPVAYKVDYTVDSEVVWSESESGREATEDRIQVERHLENVEILLTKTDGTVIDLSNAGGSLDPESGTTVCSKGEVFEEIIPMEEMESISVGGIIYPIP